MRATWRFSTNGCATHGSQVSLWKPSSGGVDQSEVATWHSLPSQNRYCNGDGNVTCNDKCNGNGNGKCNGECTVTVNVTVSVKVTAPVNVTLSVTVTVTVNVTVIVTATVNVTVSVTVTVTVDVTVLIMGTVTVYSNDKCSGACNGNDDGSSQCNDL